MSAHTRVTTSLCRLELPEWYRSSRWEQWKIFVIIGKYFTLDLCPLPPHLPAGDERAGRAGAETAAGDEEELSQSEATWVLGAAETAPLLETRLSATDGAGIVTPTLLLRTPASCQPAVTSPPPATLTTALQPAASPPSSPPTHISPTDNPTWAGGVWRDSSYQETVFSVQIRDSPPVSSTR